jgi:hypothetical protein
LPVLTDIVNANVTVLIWAGDSDWICNWLGDFYTANDIKYPGQAQFKAAPLLPYKVKGKEKGSFKTAKNLSFLRVYAAGHTVPAFRKYSCAYCVTVGRRLTVSRTRYLVAGIHPDNEEATTVKYIMSYRSI